MPYDEILELQRQGTAIDLESLVARAPSRDEFSFGTEHVSHGTAIDALREMASKLRKMETPLNLSFEDQYRWVDDRISELWNMRGPFPGLGAVLTAFGLNEGNFIAMEIAEKIARENDDPLTVNPWNLVNLMFEDPGSVLSPKLAKKIGKTICSAWKQINAHEKAHMEILSRLEVNNDQAEAFFNGDTRSESGIDDYTTRDLLGNPYLLYEAGRRTGYDISFSVVDKGLSPAPRIEELFPLPDPTRIDDPLDERRLRALVINILEDASVDGHTLFPDYLVMEKTNEMQLESAINLKRHVLDAINPFLAEKVTVIESTGELPRFYQLMRLSEVRKVIRDFVRVRILKGKRHKIEADWRKLLEKHPQLQKIDLDSLKEYDRKKEERAREEKTACLAELACSRFSVLVGPAGTGKTTLLDVLCGHPEIATGGILKLAPTGKARVKLGLSAKTLAQFLLEHKRYDPDTMIYHLNDGNRYAGARTVIIDEASMLTEEQLAALIDALEGCQRFILVGDPRQLPPIGAGRPFVDIITWVKSQSTSNEFPRVVKGCGELTVICRQRPRDSESSQNSKIEGTVTQMPERIDVQLAQRFSGQPFYDDDDDLFEVVAAQPDWPELSLIQWDDAYELREKLDLALERELLLKKETWIQDFDCKLGGNIFEKRPEGFAIKSFFNRSAASAVENWQILSPVKGYGYGVKELNREIQKSFRQDILELAHDYRAKRIPKPRGTENVVYGDKVMNVRNTKWKPWDEVYPDDAKCLRYIANGEIGIIIGKYRKKYEQWNGELPTEVVFSSQPDHAYKFKRHHFKEESESPLELAYVITIHKSQGSGFKKTFLILPNPCHLLSRELLYTALTRQEERVIILHQGELKDFRKFIYGEFSDTARRITNLMDPPRLKQIESRFYDERYINYSVAGEWMISESEVSIANLLLANNVKYAYEDRLFHPDGTSRRPDFTIVDEDRDVTYYWEHFGLLHVDEDYRKLQWYRSMGIVPYQEATEEDDRLLVITRDKPDGGIDTQEIDRIIKKVIKDELPDD